VTLWAGRVGTELAPEVWALVTTEDRELLQYDLQGTLLHAQRLHAAGILDSDELLEVEQRLAAIADADLEPSDEDVHSAIERLLGPVGARSTRDGRATTRW
jgi:argininosuccinate lyase